mmetsp:Transcript_36747/g.92121  ORF Transcript_36747/g.92121 Transcript_36747/m.92121 type:complete len:173 (+) Transcript_36747:181-699(+)|eukprot:CAMPEP_0177641308 /NCGR_PEP_ID=MMETSP0447-20121125/6995_1 /TAXON_ID=0 /ORGANISM="Stygamoeba regulata, Strain BSH-02190019" /LENGTH=172 /DNA_ID=CAMNT_0019143413 /DNA_START=174 /DNA_END=692 /DNA_ORIENTATION=+
MTSEASLSEEVDLTRYIQRSRVSSVWARDAVQFGKQFLFDKDPETCWNSNQGESQFVHVEFRRPVSVHRITLLFQGGFAAKKCELAVRQSADGEKRTVATFYPSPDTRQQDCEVSDADSILELWLDIPECYDFFGRIAIYTFGIFGSLPADDRDTGDQECSAERTPDEVVFF